ncbi:chondroitin sulfate proteoglycan 5 isoform X3 [Amia ocellicauda]|uniref:chondroitin sulfate proteoglycan 5 isoform X3 n=1 Tax=Amia ocellicauda TaxID=2972642 RepID=UPI003464605E
MDGAQTGLCGGCWRAILLSTCVLLHLIPLCVHGNSLGSNATQSDDKTNGSSPCLGCQGDEGTAGVGEQAAPVTGSAWPFALGLRAARLPRENREELGSGEGAVGVLGESSTTAPLSQGGGTATMGVTEISPDSAEKDHVMEVVPAGGTLPNSEVRPDDKGQQQEERPWHTDPPWQSSDKELAQQPQSASPAHPPSLPPPDVLTVDYYDPSVRAHKLPPPSPEPAAHELQGQPTAWTLPDGYDYLTPYEDSYSTTEVYPDEDQFTTADLMDENDPRLTSSPPTSMLTPEEVLVLLSGTQDEEPPPLAPGTAEFSNETECRPGYIRHNASCRSHCDFFPSYCFNGGQCYLVEGTGVFCRCNVQDYIWHKGSRCESVVTEFQVLCLAVGAAALMVLLLFMITVFFAKKLHLLKTENSKLRKRSSKYRPPSEQHNDNFSLSTIAEGSHPNVRKLCDTPPNLPHARALAYYDNIICQDDPNAQNKLEDPVKAPPPKDEEPLNIQNSLTPKHENNKASSDDSAEVNSLQNNMM